MKPSRVVNNRFGLLAQDAYRGIEHAASLKGLLKPFKGKGAFEDLALQTRQIELQLERLMDDTLRCAARSPYCLLDARLVKQASACGTTFLRWRTRDFSKMGVDLWEELMCNPTLPPVVRQALHEFESARITLNMQMSVVHTLRRQALDCEQKMASADLALSQHPGNHEQEESENEYIFPG